MLRSRKQRAASTRAFVLPPAVLACALAHTGLALAQTRPAMHAHVHGIATLAIALDDHAVTIQLSSPLDNLLGFERAPRTDGERAATADAIRKLQRGDALFGLDPAAGCKLSRVELSSAALNLGHPDPAEAAAGHADIDGTWEFACTDTRKARFADTALFEFEHMRTVAVQVAGPQGQFKRELERPDRRIDLTR